MKCTSIKSLELKSPVRRPGRGLPVGFVFFALTACATLPRESHESFSYPKGRAFIEKVDRQYVVLGEVKERIDFPSLDPEHSLDQLCKNYFNKAVHGLLRHAKRAGAEAVVEVRSVVFLYDGRREAYPTPECSDGGDTAQILVRGLAVKWKPVPATLKVK